MLFKMLSLEVKELHCAYGVASHELGLKFFCICSKLGEHTVSKNGVLDLFKVDIQ